MKKKKTAAAIVPPAALLIVICIVASLAGCAPAGNDDGRLCIVATIFPIYDWVRSILGDNPGDAELVLLEDGGVDLHSFQPTVEDMALIAGCDVFIYVGGESDNWVPGALSSLKNPGRTEINLLEVLGEGAAEEHIEGMQDGEHRGADGHGHDADGHGRDDDGHGHDADGHGRNDGDGAHADDRGDGEVHAGEPESDEHVWLSLRNAQLFCEHISDAIAAKDPSHSADYASNTAAYVGDLKALDGEFEAAAAQIDNKVLLFADRFPFRYFTRDYGFDYYAAFEGCSAETEAGCATIVFLADKVNEFSLDVIFCTEGSDEAIARTVRDTAKRSGLKICRLNSLQSVSAVSVREGVTYLGLMRENLESLNEAFNVH